MEKVIFITGASSGIGLASAKMLLKEGHIVYGAARRLENMAEIEQLGGRTIKLDVTDSDAIKLAVDRIVAEQGRIDVLLNNAGYGMFGAVEDVSLTEAKRQFDVNVFALAEVTKAVAPVMRENKSGKIINISSMGGKMHTPLGGWYHSSKYAVEGLSDCMRFELKQFGIDVVLIEPGAINSAWYDIMLNNLKSTAKNSHYTNYINAYEKYVVANRKHFSKTDAVAKAVCKAIKSRSPHARYSVGFMAKPSIILYKLLPSKVYDSVLRLIFK